MDVCHEDVHAEQVRLGKGRRGRKGANQVRTSFFLKEIPLQRRLNRTKMRGDTAVQLHSLNTRQAQDILPNYVEAKLASSVRVGAKPAGKKEGQRLDAHNAAIIASRTDCS
jgi:hypothetical protein